MASYRMDAKRREYRDIPPKANNIGCAEKFEDSFQVKLFEEVATDILFRFNIILPVILEYGIDGNPLHFVKRKKEWAHPFFEQNIKGLKGEPRILSSIIEEHLGILKFKMDINEPYNKTPHCDAHFSQLEVFDRNLPKGGTGL